MLKHVDTVLLTFQALEQLFIYVVASNDLYVLEYGTVEFFVNFFELGFAPKRELNKITRVKADALGFVPHVQVIKNK